MNKDKGKDKATIRDIVPELSPEEFQWIMKEEYAKDILSPLEIAAVETLMEYMDDLRESKPRYEAFKGFQLKKRILALEKNRCYFK